MGMMIPPEFEPIAKITVGQDFPKGDEDKLAQLGAVWEQAAQEINQLVGELNPATAGTFESLGGAPAEQLAQFVNQFSSTLPVMSESAQQLAILARNIALEIEYAKYLIILQLAWMAAEITYLTATVFGSAAIPAVITAGRFAIQTILRELFVAVLGSVVMQVGMDAAAQTIQLLKGDREHWDAEASVSAVEMGALDGLVGGALFHGMRIMAPMFASTFIGNVTTGALTGLGATEANNLVFNAGQPLGLGAAAGAAGGAIAHGHTPHGQRGSEHLQVPAFEVKPFTPEMMRHALSGDERPGGPGGLAGEQRPGSVEESESGPVSGGGAGEEEQLGLPDAPRWDEVELPDASPEALLADLPSASGEGPAALGPQVRRRVEELSSLAGEAGLAESQSRERAQAVREAAGAGDWGRTAQRLEEFRTTVESGLLDQRMADFRAHVDNGFTRLGELGAGEDDWRSKVDAVEGAQRTGNPVLVDSALKEYTDFVERHLPAEVLTGRDAPHSFDSGVERLRRELGAVSDPAEQQRLRRELEQRQWMQERLDRLARSDPDDALMRRRLIARQEEARSPEEAARARQALTTWCAIEVGSCWPGGLAGG
jgi:hypothetical protein